MIASLKLHTKPHKTTMAILEKLKDYSWETKAVLVLAVFAMEIGDFTLPIFDSRFESSSTRLDTSLAMLKKSPIFMTNRPTLTVKIQTTLTDNVKLVETCSLLAMNVMERIIKLQKLADVYQVKFSDIKKRELVGYSYWIIISLVVSTVKLNFLKYNEDDLYYDYMDPYITKLRTIRAELDKRLNALYNKNEEVTSYWSLVEKLNRKLQFEEIFEPSSLEILNWSWGGNALKKVDYEDTMKKKNRFFLVITSGLDVEVDDLKLMRKVVYELGLILWIPIVETWTSDTKDKMFDIAKKLDTGFLYVLQANPTQLGIRYMKEEWQYSKGKRTIKLVVMNKDYVVENSDALYLVRQYGLEASPYDRESERLILEKVSWPKIVATKINDSQLKQWIKQRKRYIFFYGGTDQKWIENFEKIIRIIGQCLESKNTKVGSFRVGGTKKSSLNEFWSTVEKIYLSGTYKDFPSVTDELRTLYSFRYKAKWALLCQGPRRVLTSDGEAFFNALLDFKGKWDNGLARNENSSSFEVVFKECYTNVINGNFATPSQIETRLGEKNVVITCDVCGCTCSHKRA